MALKITTQIGTDNGITSEAYVRIADYHVSKYGSASFRLQIYLSQADVPSTVEPTPMDGSAHNQQIGDNLWVSLTKEEQAIRTIARPVQVNTPAVLAEDGTVTTPASISWENQDVQETYTAIVPDLTPLQTGTIFEFGYTKLKEKMVGLYGADNVIDC